MTNLLKRGDKIGKLEGCSWISKGTDTERGHSFHTHRRRRCTHACEEINLLTPKALVSLKRLLNESVFSTGSPESSRKGTQCDVSQYLLLSESLAHSLPGCLLSFFGARFIHFLWAKSLIFLQAWCCVSLTSQGPSLAAM